MTRCLQGWAQRSELDRCPDWGLWQFKPVPTCSVYWVSFLFSSRG